MLTGCRSGRRRVGVIASAPQNPACAPTAPSPLLASPLAAPRSTTDRPTDRPTGPVGTCVVTTLFNARRRIDFASTASAELRQRAMLIGLGAHRRRTEIRAAVVPTLPISSGS